MKKYSVLLLYPDYVAETFGHETYWAWVKAKSPKAAIKAAQAECAKDQPDINDPTDLHPLLVVKGHHYGFSTES